MYLVKTPALVQRSFSNIVWRAPVKSTEKRIYLTFDDGPIPEVTPWVLELLASYGARATFFCVGENVQRHPELFQRLTSEGHAIGNHTYNHLNAWHHSTADYLANVEACAALVPSKLFRPPYGKLGLRTAMALRPTYDIVLWDVLSGDFDQRLSPQACLKNVLNAVQPDSIVVFHDSLKSEKRLRYTLPGVLQELSRQGYAFAALPYSEL